MNLRVREKAAEEFLGALVAGELMNKHYIITAYTLNNPNVIRLEPPLTVSYAQLDRMIDALDQVCQRNKGFGDMLLSSAKTVIGNVFKRNK